MTPFITRAVGALGILTCSTIAVQAQECANRGALDMQYCDANGDLVADTPTDPAELSDPDTLVFAYTPVEDPAVYADIWEPFIEHLSEVTGKDVQFFASAVKLGRGRGHAFGQTARGRLFYWADTLCGEPCRCCALRHHGR